MSKKIRIAITDIKLPSSTPRIGSDIISFNKNKMLEKISDVQNIVNKALIDPSTSTNPVILNKDNLAETLIRAI